MIDTKRPKWVIAGAVALIAGVFALPAIAVLGEPVTDTQTDGVTTVTWDSSFEDPDYTLGAALEVTVTWTVDAGLAEYDSFVQRFPNFTPKGPDPANGSGFSVGTVTKDEDGGSVDFQFRFDELHCDEENDVEVGNAHFSLILNVDTDGDGAADSLVGYGVNVHVEQPGECTSDGDDDNGGPPPGVPPTGNDIGAQGDDTEVLQTEVEGDDEDLDDEDLDVAIAELSEDIPGDADDVRANVVTMLEFIAGNGGGDDEEIDSAPGAFGKGVAALANQISDEDDGDDEEEDEEGEEEGDSEAQGGPPAGTPAGRP